MVSPTPGLSDRILFISRFSSTSKSQVGFHLESTSADGRTTGFIEQIPPSPAPVFIAEASCSEIDACLWTLLIFLILNFPSAFLLKGCWARCKTLSRDTKSRV